MKKITRFLVSFSITFIIIFAVAFLAKIFIDAFIFSQKAVNYKYILFDLIVVIVFSLLLTLFYQINKTTILVQVIVTFITMLLVIYSFGIISGWFGFNNLGFSLIAIGFNVLGLLGVFLIIYFIKKKQASILNKELESYKERDNYEKN